MYSVVNIGGVVSRKPAEEKGRLVLLRTSPECVGTYEEEKSAKDAVAAYLVDRSQVGEGFVNEPALRIDNGNDVCVWKNFQAHTGQMFFLARGINIPRLDPDAWKDGLDGPPAASFVVDVLTEEVIYESGSGRTRVIIGDPYVLVFDLTGNDEHKQSLFAECCDIVHLAGRVPTDPAKAMGWPRTNQVGDIPVGCFSKHWQGGRLVACLDGRDAL